MSWATAVIADLDSQNYQEVINYYETELQKDPENISLYWYLGLAYLLGGQEAEAAATWLGVFAQGDEESIEIWTTELISILEAEAIACAQLQNHHTTWLIRQQILELNPYLVNNLLHLLELEIILQKYQPTKLQEWQVAQVIAHSDYENIDQQLFSRILEEVLRFPAYESVEFAQAIVDQSTKKQPLIAQIARIAQIVCFDLKYPLYAIDLNQICLHYASEDPPYYADKLSYYKNQFWYNIQAETLSGAIAAAAEFYQRADTLVSQIFGMYQQLYIQMMLANWTKVLEYKEVYQELLSRITQIQPLTMYRFLTQDFIPIGQPLLYIEDNPRQNRPLINAIGTLFQKTVRQMAPKPELLAASPPRAPHQRLRIGYVAHTLRKHSVGWLCRWLFHHHDHEKFEIYIYLITQESTEFTRTWFEAKADHTYYAKRNIHGLTAQIKADEIDILVDLDSITLNLTCQLFSYKPAPIQVTWLGLDASGIPNIDYFIADPYVLPRDAQDYYQEKIWRLPQTYLAVDGFEIGIPSLTRDSLDIPSDAIIYLNIQNSLKRNPYSLELQMQILQAVPNSYFLTKGTGDRQIIRQFFTEAATRYGISLDRLRFLDLTPNEETHRANLAIADVVLDTYPYNGATSTLEVLWMGIPLVTRVGEQFAARNSYTFMRNANLTEGIAWTDAEYVGWGIKFGTDEQLRQQVSWKLRQSRHHAPLWQAKQFTRAMEEAYQQMWQKYLNPSQ